MKRSAEGPCGKMFQRVRDSKMCMAFSASPLVRLGVQLFSLNSVYNRMALVTNRCCERGLCLYWLVTLNKAVISAHRPGEGGDGALLGHAEQQLPGLT